MFTPDMLDAGHARSSCRNEDVEFNPIAGKSAGLLCLGGPQELQACCPCLHATGPGQHVNEDGKFHDNFHHKTDSKVSSRPSRGRSDLSQTR